jgi:hypothetical protein
MFNMAGSVCALLGILICAVAAAVRLSGSFYLGGIAVGVVFNAGIGLLVLAILLKVEALIHRSD